MQIVVLIEVLLGQPIRTTVSRSQKRISFGQLAITPHGLAFVEYMCRHLVQLKKGTPARNTKSSGMFRHIVTSLGSGISSCSEANCGDSVSETSPIYSSMLDGEVE